MTEEQARQNDQERSQSNENLESYQTLKNSVEELFASVFSFQDQKEKKTMINEEPRQENNPQPPLNSPEPERPPFPETAIPAILQFLSIKEALTGPSLNDRNKEQKTWVLPQVDPRAQESDPKP